MKKDITYVGLDVHKDSIYVVALKGSEKHEWKMSNDARAPQRLAQRLRKLAGGAELQTCYEAGPCGYVLKRELEKRSVPCKVVAPSLIPVRPGERIKTDRRDAAKLARELRNGALTEVHAPTAAEEAVRDLCRCREDAQGDLKRAKQRLGKFLLRHGLVYREGRPWTQRHTRWLAKLELEHAAAAATFSEYRIAVVQRQERVDQIAKELEVIARSEPYRKHVGWLRCFRGIDTVTAITVLAEIHNFRRFPTAPHLMSYLGLTPSEYSSGGRQLRGGITKAGNGHVRRLLIEAAWHNRHRPNVSAKLRLRRLGQPKEIIEIADRAQRRLHKRYCKLLLGSNKPSAKVTTAIARELVGFIWAVTQLEEAHHARL